MSGGILLGCALVLIVGLRAVGEFLTNDPCEGDGTWRAPVQNYTYEQEDEEE